ncbi:LamG-like jellyroll fold domain-containing protein [Leptothrix discophora]|uniref:LamG-like jellyroll fold domain-containing protein n=1 Tax=Leptothrix discophora TaxID=89 RepID=A0ABT9FXV5_LEPDI|nr:LamG-like jellyroll fold domain-containing protein [Leptothrix discophora]MDP4299069.1 LamG-like jellyroll fold domain-containing protein [Leptothrix discophora]
MQHPFKTRLRQVLLAAGLACAAQAQAATPLLGLYTFEGANGNFGNVVDASGNNKNPVSYGAVSVTTGGQGYQGEAARFSPASYLAPTGGFEVDINITQGVNPNGMTIGGWINLASERTAQGANTFFSHDNGGWDRGVWYNRDTNTWQSRAYTALSGSSSSSAMNIGQWYFVVATFDGSVGNNVNMYLDGRYIGQTPFGEDGNPAPYLRFGAYDNNSTTEPFSGRMDNVFVFGGVLSQNEINTIQQGGVAGIQQVAGVSPVPEPETYAMMLAGLGVIGSIARRRRQA